MMDKGTIFKFYNDLDTDQIIASQYLLLPNLEEMKAHTFESQDPDFAKKVKPGSRGELRLRFFKRTGTWRFKSPWCKGCYCQIICQNLFQKCH